VAKGSIDLGKLQDDEAEKEAQKKPPSKPEYKSRSLKEAQGERWKEKVKDVRVTHPADRITGLSGGG
jgi:hypothetical protein